ncbi:hypothetical protein LSH36_353g01040 [Paralvinella palmiformis]|uniref:Uncharacterized protein n=1 Tax=Paralvinella palmiformis TaxID=53620 RepID=A0AAD9N2D9_9ANNE|nr:hypothetical protein LSH36_353g01040 [Paralvinella palmiformis]
MLIDNKPVTFQVVSGASANIIPAKIVPGHLTPTSTIIVMWNEARVRSLGTGRMSIHNPKNKNKYSVEFYVVDDNSTPLLGARANQSMGLVTKRSDNFARIAAVAKDIIHTYSDVFENSLGELPEPASLKVDPTVKSHIAHPRRIPLALKEGVKDIHMKAPVYI